MKAKAPTARALFALAAFVLLALQLALTARAQKDERGLALKPGATVKELPAKAKRWALVIGVDQYKDRQIGSLGGAANDARALAAALNAYAGFPADQVILLSTDQPEERQPTRVNILRRLSNLASVVPKDGLLLFSFAGHGMERNGQAYLLPSDAQIADDVSFLEDTAISVARMRDRIKATGVGQVLVLLDACRNDPGGRADAPNMMTSAYKFDFDLRNREVQAFATLYATAVGQRAYEYAEKKQGYFTWAVVEGLKGGAADDKGEVTLARLVNYVQGAVPKRIGIDLGLGKQQRPFAVIEGYRAEELIVAVPGRVPPTTIDAGAGPKTLDMAAAEVGLWNSIGNSTNAADYKAYLEKYPDGRFAAEARQRLSFLEAAAQYAGLQPGQNSLVLYGAAVGFLRGANGFMIITGSGFGGTDARVFVNGKDVSAQIIQQSNNSIRLDGTKEQLNVLSGKNEVVVKIGDKSSAPYVFTQIIR